MCKSNKYSERQRIILWSFPFICDLTNFFFKQNRWCWISAGNITSASSLVISSRLEFPVSLLTGAWKRERWDLNQIKLRILFFGVICSAWVDVRFKLSDKALFKALMSDTNDYSQSVGENQMSTNTASHSQPDTGQHQWTSEQIRLEHTPTQAAFEYFDRIYQIVVENTNKDIWLQQFVQHSIDLHAQKKKNILSICDWKGSRLMTAWIIPCSTVPEFRRSEQFALNNE